MKHLIIFMALAVILAGCTSARISRDLSSGVIGCPSEDITIVDEEATISGTHTWIAVCDDKRYACSYHTTTGANCKELAGDSE